MISGLDAPSVLSAPAGLDAPSATLAPELFSVVLMQEGKEVYSAQVDKRTWRRYCDFVDNAFALDPKATEIHFNVQHPYENVRALQYIIEYLKHYSEVDYLPFSLEREDITTAATVDFRKLATYKNVRYEWDANFFDVNYEGYGPVTQREFRDVLQFAFKYDIHVLYNTSRFYFFLSTQEVTYEQFGKRWKIPTLTEDQIKEAYKIIKNPDIVAMYEFCTMKYLSDMLAGMKKIKP